MANAVAQLGEARVRVVTRERGADQPFGRVAIANVKSSGRALG
jgi:hypothetical protein